MDGRDKRRRAKKRRGDAATGRLGETARSNSALQTHNPAGTVVLPKVTEPIAGKYCRVRRAKIDGSTCIVQSMRTPEFCRGCNR